MYDAGSGVLRFAFTCASAFGSGFENSRFAQELLKPNGFAYVASAPLQAPVLDGYAGALHLYRTPEQGDFTQAELATLADIARELDDILISARQHRLVEENEAAHPLIHRPASRQFIFDQNQKQVLTTSNLSDLDERLQQQIKQHAANRLGHVNGEAVTSDRLPLPDADGDLWIFRAVTRKHYPALGDGPFAIVSAIYGFWLVQAVFFLATWALFHHMLGGIRHFVWDSIHALDPAGRQVQVALLTKGAASDPAARDRFAAAVRSSGPGVLAADTEDQGPWVIGTGDLADLLASALQGSEDRDFDARMKALGTA